MAEKTVAGTPTQQATAEATAHEDNLAFAQAMELPADVATALIPKTEKGSHEGTKARKEETPKLDEDGNPIPKEEEVELDADGNPIPKEEEVELDADGNPIPKEEEVAPKTQAAFNKRVGELTKARRTAEEERDALRIENASLKAHGGADSRPIATPNDPLADVLDEPTLNATVARAQSLKTWAIANLDGGTMPDGKGGEVEFDADKVKEILANVDAVLTVHAPNRKNYLQAAGAFEAAALERYPELKKADSPETKAVEAIVRDMPELKRFPNWRMIAGHIVAGLKLERDAAAAKAKGAKKPAKEVKTVATAFKPRTKEPIAPAAPLRSTATPRKHADNTERTKEAKLRHVIESNGSVDALTAAFA